ncbi:rho GTPase-activating protein 100F-like protein [Dinothrombium tinctorium]|uniref:Rho GTPase-activating protein 100F-like protein n=1 Tax=Dinothrombium tinctorium TaxID=1965070 RepID=A0A443RMC0_9ACAR|nr:rho GTPase-activating protein 100F-like protein [Dinothrombium tinctorium]
MNQRIIGEGTSLGYTSHPQYQYYQQPAGSQHLRRAVHFQGNTYHDPSGEQRSRMPEMVLQSDFRKVSGISSEVFRQIEAVEKDFDATTAANLEAVEKRGEMIIRLLDPRQLGRAGTEAGWKYLAGDGSHSVQFVEIIKRPGQTLGLYIREGDGFRCTDGVFISRIALESPVYNSGLLKVGDEILAVNLVDVRRMSLDDVVIIMSIPRRLVLTIRSRTCRSGVHPSVEMMTGRRAFGEEYRQPPVVVVKKDLGEEDNFVNDELSSNRDSENGHLLQARLKGLPAEIPPVAVSLSATDSMMFGDMIYNRPAMRLPQSARDDNWTQMKLRGNDFRTRPYGVVTRQPHSLQRQYPRTLENLSDQVHQYYSGYSSDVPMSRRAGNVQVTSASVHRPMIERGTSTRNRFWDELGTGSLRRGRLLRTESDNRIHPTASDYFLDQYARPLSRGSLRSQTPTSYLGLSQMHGMRQRRNDDLRQSLSTHGLSSIMRRRKITDGSVSDTEVDSITASRPHSISLRNRSLGRYPPSRGRTARDLFGNRSHSLPRTRTEPFADYRYSKTSPFRRHQRGQSVRFDRSFGYDDDSDGAVSAPELPDDTRAKRLLGRRGPSPGGYSSDEYRQWLRRAPSTSAIYETIRRTGRSSTLPSGLSSTSLYRIAHSAESLLDTIRMEQQKTLLADLYATRAAEKASPLPSLLAKRDYSSDSLAALKHGQRNRAHIRSHSLGLDYLRAIPNPTPVKASEHERMHLLTLNPREFFKYRYEKPSNTEITTEAITEGSANKANNGYNGIMWVHLLAGRGLRSVNAPPNNRDLYCVIECDRIHKARTVVRSGESSFDWDEVFELDIYETKEISFLLYSWDPQSRHKLCYKGIINLISLSLTETPVHSLALKMEPKGTLYVKMRYKDPSIIFQRAASASSLPSALFGVDLETVVNRENSGFNVPLLVKRCVEEIERRGLDLVGIYRLCGSAVRKKMLRDAFEKNAWLVDLSAEHVPDINHLEMTSQAIANSLLSSQNDSNIDFGGRFYRPPISDSTAKTSNQQRSSIFGTALKQRSSNNDMFNGSFDIFGRGEKSSPPFTSDNGCNSNKKDSASILIPGNYRQPVPRSAFSFPGDGKSGDFSDSFESNCSPLTRISNSGFGILPQKSGMRAIRAATFNQSLASTGNSNNTSTSSNGDNGDVDHVFYSSGSRSRSTSPSDSASSNSGNSPENNLSSWLSNLNLGTSVTSPDHLTASKPHISTALLPVATAASIPIAYSSAAATTSTALAELLPDPCLNSFFGDRRWQSPSFFCSGFDPHGDAVERAARLHRNAASYSEAKCTWSGQLTTRVHKNPIYSCKVFLGGVPWDITEAGLIEAFQNFGTIKVQWPGKEVRSMTTNPSQKAGYVYIIFESDKQVRALLSTCTHDFSNGGKWYFNISSRRMRCKEVQVIPWVLSDSNYVRCPSQRLDPNKTVFVGALHGMMNAEGLAQIMNDLFGGVVYVGIDTDKYKYPIGAARVTFSNTKSYMKAVAAGFIDIKCARFSKKASVTCMRFKLISLAFSLDSGGSLLRERDVFKLQHATRSSLLKDYIRELPEPLFTKALFDMMVDGLSVCLPDDPAGNAKLMFSILECLPKISRCTVLHLLDHLRLVVSHSDRNKMTPQAMAICFGPLFTCHSETESFKKPIEVFKFLLEIWPIRRGKLTIFVVQEILTCFVAGSASRSASNDSILNGKGTNVAPTSLTHESSGMNLPNTTTASHNNSSQMMKPNSDHLPLATLTPGPSPTAFSKVTQMPMTSTSDNITDVEASGNSSMQRNYQQGLQSQQTHYTNQHFLSQPQSHYSSQQQQHLHQQQQQQQQQQHSYSQSQYSQQQTQPQHTYSQQKQQHVLSQHEQQQNQQYSQTSHQQSGTSGVKKSVAWAAGTHSNSGSNNGTGHGNDETSQKQNNRNNFNDDSIR